MKFEVDALNLATVIRSYLVNYDLSISFMYDPRLEDCRNSLYLYGERTEEGNSAKTSIINLLFLIGRQNPYNDFHELFQGFKAIRRFTIRAVKEPGPLKHQPDFLEIMYVRYWLNQI